MATLVSATGCVDHLELTRLAAGSRKLAVHAAAAKSGQSIRTSRFAQAMPPRASRTTL